MIGVMYLSTTRVTGQQAPPSGNQLDRCDVSIDYTNDWTTGPTLKFNRLTGVKTIVKSNCDWSVRGSYFTYSLSHVIADYKCCMQCGLQFMSSMRGTTLSSTSAYYRACSYAVILIVTCLINGKLLILCCLLQDLFHTFSRVQ